MKALIMLVGLMVVVMARAQGPATFTGVITDSECADGDHTFMRMGPTDAECTIACVLAHGSSYVLYDGEASYALSDQETPEKFAGQEVVVTGTLDQATRRIEVVSMTTPD